MYNFKYIKIQTKYLLPGDPYDSIIINAIRSKIRNGDIVVLSEKALSVAIGNIADESKIHAGLFAKLIVLVWMRIIWPYFLGRIAKLIPKTINRLRSYPLDYGARHKQLALWRVGFLQALRHYSEGGIDGSNLPYAYVALPLKNPQEVANKIRAKIRNELNVRVTVIIVDGDTTYSWNNLHLAPRKVHVKGLIHFGGFLTFIIGRMFNGKRSNTPIAISGMHIPLPLLLKLSRRSHKIRGYGAGLTVWDMIRRFKTSIDGVTPKMLMTVPHYPIVIIRPYKKSEK